MHAEKYATKTYVYTAFVVRNLLESLRLESVLERAMKTLDPVGYQEPMAIILQIRVRWTKAISYAGMYRGATIDLQEGLAIPGREKQLGEILMHELGHAIVHLLQLGSGGHSKEWKETMILLGFPAEMYHDLTWLEELYYKRRVVVYLCEGCGCTWKRTRRFPREKTRVCGRCKTPITRRENGSA